MTTINIKASGFACPFRVVEIVQKAVEIYERIHDAPDTIRQLGRRMRRMKTILASLENHLRSNSKHPLVMLREAQTHDLLRLIDDTREDCGKVYVLFDKWERKIGPLGTQFKDNAFAQYVAQAYFTLGSSLKELESLAASIDYQRSEIDTYLGLMGAQGHKANHDLLKDIQSLLKAQGNTTVAQPDLEKQIQELIKAQSSSAAAQTKSEKQIKALTNLLKAQAKADVSQSVAPSQLKPPDKFKGGSTKPRRSPSPSPSPQREDFKIIFVDPHNIGRSVCAEALTKLYESWTRSTSKPWRITTVDSVGFFCKKGNDCTDLIDGLDYKYGSYKLEMAQGGKNPDKVATAAIFDNNTFKDPSLSQQKALIQSATDARRSVGIKKDVFKIYDYIIVFTNREHDNLIKLRSALITSEGKAAAPKNTGRVVHLGRYLSKDGSVQEIMDPPKGRDGVHSRSEWNKKTAQIKMAVRGFLQAEMEWKSPGKSEAQ